MKPILKITMLFVVALFAANAGYTQSIAGADRSIPFKFNANGDLLDPEPIELKAEGDAAACCFQWSTDSGRFENNYATDRQTVKVIPLYPKATYTVVRKCADGEKTGSVTVHYYDFRIVSVTPKYDCYLADEQINISDYDIVTEPLGYEKDVTNVTSYYIKQNSIETSMSVQFRKIFGEAQTVSTTVNVINTDAYDEFGLGTTLPVELKKLEEKQEELGKALAWMFKKGPRLPIAIEPPCQPEFNISHTLKIVQKKLCCSDTDPRTKGSTKVSYEYECSTGIECTWPIPYLSIPKVVGLNIKIGLTYKEKSTISYEETCDKPEICFNLNPELEAFGGISFDVAGGALLEVAGLVVGTASLSALEVCVYPNFKLNVGEFCTEAKAKATAKALSFVEATWEFPLTPKYCTPVKLKLP